MFDRAARYLVLVTDDPDLLAVVPWIEGEVRIARDFDEASHQIDGSRGWAVLALGQDALRSAIDNGRLPNYPFTLVFPAGQAVDLMLIMRLNLQSDQVRELPTEIDWLHDKLGQYKPPARQIPRKGNDVHDDA